MKAQGPGWRTILIVLCVFAWATPLLPASARAEAEADSHDQARLPSPHPLQLVVQRECSQRAGPYATQDTAWQRWRAVRSQGYAVSNGVAPCYEARTRGYCFFVFFPC
jgi:hypothetical protein